MAARIKLIESPHESKSQDYYVYVIFRPNWVPCYVGKGRRNRYLKHFKKCYNPHLAAIIKNAGGRLPVLKIQEGLSNRRAAKLEIDFIRIIGREMNGGTLVNQTDGGDGVVGKSPEWCARHSALLKGRPLSIEHRAKIGAASKGHTLSEEVRKGISLKHLGMKPSEETRAKMSKSAKRRVERLGVPFKGKHRPEKTKERLREDKIGKKHTTEHNKKIGDALRGKSLTESHRLAILESWEARRCK